MLLASLERETASAVLKLKAAGSGSPLDVGERIFEGAGFERRRIEDHLLARQLELIDAVALDSLILHEQNARVRLLAGRAKPHVAGNRLERRLVQVVGQKFLVEALGGLDRLRDDLHARIGKRRSIEAQRVGALARGAALIAGEEVLDARELQGRLGHVGIEARDAVEQWAELLHSLGHYPNLAGIKDSVSDPEVYHRFVAEFPRLNMRTGTDVNLKYALEHGMGAILAEGNNFTKQIAAVFAAKRAGKDIDEPIEKLNAALKLLRAGGVDEYGPMKYALSLQMGTRQFYQRPPNSDVTEEQKATIKAALEEIKRMG